MRTPLLDDIAHQVLLARSRPRVGHGAIDERREVCHRVVGARGLPRRLTATTVRDTDVDPLQCSDVVPRDGTERPH